MSSSKSSACLYANGALPGPRAVSPPVEPAGPPLTLIRPPHGWQAINLGELWLARELLYFLIWRDVKVRYKQTVLGIAWAVLQPLLMMVVFTVFFGRLAGIATADVPYPLFAYAGLLPWTFFATALSSSSNSVVGSERLITKIYFPRLLVPFAAVGAAGVDFVMAFVLLVILMIGYGVWPGVSMLLIPVVFAVILLAALGCGTALAALNVRYRDFRYVVPFLVQFWMFATPSVYMQPAATSSGWVQTILALNPMTPLIAAFRAACLGGPFPWLSFSLATGCVVLVFLGACLYFRRAEDSFADTI